MNLDARIILIPWDHLFKDPTKERHVVTLSSSMGNTISNSIRNRSKRILHQKRSIGISCFYDDCLNYSYTDLEDLYEDTKESIFKMLKNPMDQEWLFANSMLLKEFQYFFSKKDVQYLEPSFLEDPFTLLVSVKGGIIHFSYPRPNDLLICIQ